MLLTNSINTTERIPGSEYFTWHEALWLPKMQAYALPSAIQMAAITLQAAALDKVRDHFGKPIEVHVWLRPRAYNEYIKGATASRHLRGDATDFHVVGMPIEAARQELRKLGSDLYPGRGEIDSTDWIHLDLMPGAWFYGRPK